MLVLVLEMFVLGRKSSMRIWISVGIMVLGGILAGVYDTHMSVIGYVCVGLCCVATACYLIMIVSVTKSTGLDTWGLLFYNNVLSLPIMLLTTMSVTREFVDVRYYEYIGSGRFWGFLLVSAAQATVLNVAIFLCTNVNSPLATTVTGQIKDIVTVVFGMFAFGGVEVRFANVFGLGVALFGSLLYSLAKYKAVMEKRKLEKMEDKEEGGLLKRRDSQGSIA